MEQEIHNFKDSFKKSKILRKPLDLLYNTNGSFEHEVDVYTQRMEIDGYWKMLNGKIISVEEKCHGKDWSFSEEMLFEMEHWNLDGSFRRKGWALGLMKSDVIIDFCFKTGDFYIYKTDPLMTFIRACYYNSNFPSDIAYKNCRNDNFTTNNLKMPRKRISQHLIMSGNIKNESVTIK